MGHLYLEEVDNMKVKELRFEELHKCDSMSDLNSHVQTLVREIT